MKSETSRKIKERTKANDVFYTPKEVVENHIKLIDSVQSDKWYDPFYGKGAYYNAFPTDNKDWSEIEKGKDFFEYSGSCDIICSNPPYSMIDKVLEKSVELNPRVISYLIGQGNLTTRRIEYMNTNGYFLKKLHFLKIWKWYGMSYICVFEKGSTNCLTFDRKIYHIDKE
jgi:hypothetical protein